MSTAILIAKGMKSRAVVHLGEMRKFVANYENDKILGKKHQVIRQLNHLGGSAMPKFEPATPDDETCGMDV